MEASAVEPAADEPVIERCESKGQGRSAPGMRRRDLGTQRSKLFGPRAGEGDRRNGHHSARLVCSLYVPSRGKIRQAG